MNLGGFAVFVMWGVDVKGGGFGEEDGKMRFYYAFMRAGFSRCGLSALIQIYAADTLNGFDY